jgi:hypothetical protein
MSDELKPCAYCKNTDIKPIHICNIDNRALYRVRCYEHNLVRYWLNYIEKQCNLKETKCKPEEKE